MRRLKSRTLFSTVAAAVAAAHIFPKYALASCLSREPLPGNVAELTCASTARGGVCRVYLVGTWCGNSKSREEVRSLIESVKPQVVFLQLCPDRAYHLEPENATEGFGELFVANEEAKKCGAEVILGDRPYKITFDRASFRSIDYFWECLVSPFTLSFSELFKKKYLEKDDLGAHNLARDELLRVFPSFYEPMLTESDQYVSAKLLEVAREHDSVVAVVGSTHLRGIQKHWEQPVDVEQLLNVPPKKLIRRILFAVYMILKL